MTVLRTRLMRSPFWPLPGGRGHLVMVSLIQSPLEHRMHCKTDMLWTSRGAWLGLKPGQSGARLRSYSLVSQRGLSLGSFLPPHLQLPKWWRWPAKQLAFRLVPSFFFCFFCGGAPDRGAKGDADTSLWPVPPSRAQSGPATHGEDISHTIFLWQRLPFLAICYLSGPWG